MVWARENSLGAWTLPNIETGNAYQSKGRNDRSYRRTDRNYPRLRAKNGNIIAELKPWMRIDGDANDINQLSEMSGHYRARNGYQFGAAIVCLQGQYNGNRGYAAAELGFSYSLT